MYKIVYLPRAVEDITGAIEYLVTKFNSPSAAESLLTELNRIVGLLREFPHSNELYLPGRPMRDEIRRVPVRGYVLFYAVKDDMVEIRRLLHERQDRRIL